MRNSRVYNATPWKELKCKCAVLCLDIKRSFRWTRPATLDLHLVGPFLFSPTSLLVRNPSLPG
jgi:hypothetical protein